MGARREPEKVTKKFKVIGKHKIAGVGKGEIVTLTMTPGSMNCLMQSGAIQEVMETPAPVQGTTASKDIKKGASNG